MIVLKIQRSDRGTNTFKCIKAYQIIFFNSCDYFKVVNFSEKMSMDIDCKRGIIVYISKIVIGFLLHLYKNRNIPCITTLKTSIYQSQ